VIVSPLTTLLANGMSPAAVINMLSSAGLSGLDERDLYTDPMGTLPSMTGPVTERDLTLLQANMAVNAFMVATDNFSYGGPATVADSPVVFADIVAMVQESLNTVLYQQLASTIGTDFTVGDMANMAVVVTNNATKEINNQVKSGGPIDTMTPIDNALANATTIADNFYQTRMGGSATDPGTGTGGTTTPPATGTPDGQALVSNNCIGCHNIGQGGTMDLSGKGDAAYGKISSGHNGIVMTDLEANAVADYLDTLTSSSNPTAPFVHPYFADPRRNHRSYVNSNGTSDCVSCHGTDLRGSGSAPSCYSCHGQKW